MAAIAYPLSFPSTRSRRQRPRPGASRSERDRSHLQLVRDLDAALAPPMVPVVLAPVRRLPPSAQPAVFVRRRLGALVVVLASLFGLWSLGGVLAGDHGATPAMLPGAIAVKGGQVYIAQRGDTLWSIASRIYPSGDPRPLVAQLDAELHGATLQPGARLVVP